MPKFMNQTCDSNANSNMARVQDSCIMKSTKFGLSSSIPWPVSFWKTIPWPISHLHMIPKLKFNTKHEAKLHKKMVLCITAIYRNNLDIRVYLSTVVAQKLNTISRVIAGLVSQKSSIRGTWTSNALRHQHIPWGMKEDKLFINHNTSQKSYHHLLVCS